MCRFETIWMDSDLKAIEKTELLIRLEGLAMDGLIEYDKTNLRVTDKGRPFVRNISMAFDRYLPAVDPEKKMFSLTV